MTDRLIPAVFLSLKRRNRLVINKFSFNLFTFVYTNQF